ncbi:MAG TPA: PaaI family thioesterase [Deltaproteobacteria bacterium]|nr:PaaI family thioesterase [Deltaproteobacteria bacterium]HOI05511.1 PaaI family thioesterase [Deltaproteobacteria bacterium]
MKDLDLLKRYFARDAFARACGIEITEASDGRASAMVKITDTHLNGIGLVHGGLVYTLADMAFAAAVHTRGRVAVSVNASITYIKAARGDTLRAEAVEVSRSGRLASYTVNILDASGEVVALLQGLAYVKDEKLS